MKKILYLLAFLTVIAFSFTACTEEEVSPSIEANGGGGGSDPVK